MSTQNHSTPASPPSNASQGIQATHKHNPHPSSNGAGVPGIAGGVGDGHRPSPPLLIGGLIQQNPNTNQHIYLSGVGFDYLTVTVPTQTSAELLLHHSAHHEPGNPSTGFKATEQRVCQGGYCWRKYDPHQPSKLWGTDYESWEFSGATSSDPIRLLRAQPAQPSRIDIAFDYTVSKDLYPMQLEPLFLEHCNANGTDIEWKGKRLKQTVYVGSQHSRRRIRIYRRDLKNLLLAEEGIHILRVELELKKDMARAFWRHYVEHGQESAYEAAAAHVAEMIGYAPIETTTGVPEVLRTNEDAQAYQMLLQFVNQNAVMIQACERCGIDLAKLTDHKIQRAKSRMAQHRLDKRIDILASLDASDLEQMIMIHL